MAEKDSGLRGEDETKSELRTRLLIVLDHAVHDARLSRDEARSLLDMFDREHKATKEPIWAIAFRGETENYVCVDEYWEVREYAEDALADIRKSIAAGKYSADEFEPVVLMQGTLTRFRPVESDWKPALLAEGGRH